MARLSYQYPSTSPYIEEQPLWITFSASTYSLVNRDRTRDILWNRRFADLTLPMPKVPGYSLKHEFGEGTNPVGPVLSMGAVANSGGFKNFDTLWNRILAPDVALANVDSLLFGKVAEVLGGKESGDHALRAVAVAAEF